VLVVGLVIVVALWAAVLAAGIRTDRLKATTLLSINMWVVTLVGSALSVVRRVDAGGLATTLLMVGTGVVLFLLSVSVVGGRKAGLKGGWILFITCGLTALEVYYLLRHPSGTSSSIPEVLALAFLPGFVFQIRNSGASREYLLRLAARVSTFVVYTSVIIGVIAPTLAYSQGFSDHRRLDIGPITMRLGGLTPHPNLLSITALMCIVLVLALKMRGRWLSALVGVAAIGLAESRSAAVTLAVVLIVVWVCKGRNLLLRSTIALPLSVFLVASSSALEDSDAAASLTSDISTNGRFRVWDLVIQTFTANPLDGWGPLAFQTESGSPFLSAGLLHAHNQVLQGIAEAGLFGGILTVALLLALVWIGLRHMREPVYPAMVVVFLLSVPTEPFLTLHLYGLNYAVLPAFIMLAVMMSADAQSDDPAPDPVVEGVESRKLPGAWEASDSRHLLGLGKLREDANNRTSAT